MFFFCPSFSFCGTFGRPPPPSFCGSTPGPLSPLIHFLNSDGLPAAGRSLPYPLPSRDVFFSPFAAVFSLSLNGTSPAGRNLVPPPPEILLFLFWRSIFFEASSHGIRLFENGKVGLSGNHTFLPLSFPPCRPFSPLILRMRCPFYQGSVFPGWLSESVIAPLLFSASSPFFPEFLPTPLPPRR